MLISGDSVQNSLMMLMQMLELVKKAGLKLNLAKCSFLQTHLEYLGHEISANGVRPEKKMILAVQEFPEPTNIHGVRQFLGWQVILENLSRILR